VINGETSITTLKEDMDIACRSFRGK